MRPTRARVLVTLAVLAGAVAWGVARVVDGMAGRLVGVPWLAAVTLWLLAAAVTVWALLSRPRLLRRPGARPMLPMVAARTAALAMACSRVGALVGGVYAGLAAAALPALDSPAGRDTAAAAAAAALGSLSLVVAALWLERMCRITDGDDPPGSAGRSASSATGEPGTWPAPAARHSGPWRD